MRLLPAALILLISAQVPAGVDLHAVAEKLREAAVAAGCPKPTVAIRWRGGRQPAEIDVRCPEARP